MILNVTLKQTIMQKIKVKKFHCKKVDLWNKTFSTVDFLLITNMKPVFDSNPLFSYNISLNMKLMIIVAMFKLAPVTTLRRFSFLLSLIR